MENELNPAQIPSQCRECPGAIFLKRAYDQAAQQESLAMNVEAEAALSGEEEVATLASSTLEKVSARRKIAEGGLNGLKDCPGYTGECAKGIIV